MGQQLTPVGVGLAGEIRVHRPVRDGHGELLSGGLHQVRPAGCAEVIGPPRVFQVHLIPVMLGAGVRLFDHIGGKPIEFERTAVVATPHATHLRYRVVR